MNEVLPPPAGDNKTAFNLNNERLLHKYIFYTKIKSRWSLSPAGGGGSSTYKLLQLGVDKKAQ